MSDAHAQARHVASHRLKSRPAGRDDAYRPGGNRIREAQRHAVDDRCAGIRPHHQEALLAAQFLERDFVLDRDVIAKKEDVQPLAQRLAGDAAGIATGDGNEHQVRPLQPLNSSLHRLGWGRHPAFHLGGVRGLEQSAGFFHCDSCGLLRCGAHGDDQVIAGCGFGLRCEQVGAR